MLFVSRIGMLNERTSSGAQDRLRFHQVSDGNRLEAKGYWSNIGGFLKFGGNKWQVINNWVFFFLGRIRKFSTNSPKSLGAAEELPVGQARSSDT
jgi:hypothetical protein